MSDRCTACRQRQVDHEHWSMPRIVPSLAIIRGEVTVARIGRMVPPLRAWA